MLVAVQGFAHLGAGRPGRVAGFLPVANNAADARAVGLDLVQLRLERFALSSLVETALLVREKADRLAFAFFAVERLVALPQESLDVVRAQEAPRRGVAEVYRRLISV